MLLNRIGWGKAYLKTARLVQQPERAFVQITEKGKKILDSDGYSFQDLKNDLDYKAHVALRESESSEESTDVATNEATPEDLIESGVRAIENDVRTELLEKLKGVDPYYFERVILKLLKKMGYGNFIGTAKSGDGGIDGIINQDQLGLDRIYVQSKRYTDNRVNEKEIRDFIGAMSSDTEKGIFVTTSSFADAAINKAKKASHTIILIDGSRLVQLMHEFNIGVQIKNVYEVKQVDEDFFEET